MESQAVGTSLRTIWTRTSPDGTVNVFIFDQTKIPFEQVVVSLATALDFERCIKTMQVRGAPLIGVTAAYGMFVAGREIASQVDESGDWQQDFGARFRVSGDRLKATRPTAVNLAWAVDRQIRLAEETLQSNSAATPRDVAASLLRQADAICEDDVKMCNLIGEAGSRLLSHIWERISEHRQATLPKVKGKHPYPNHLNVLTHCNAGLLACVTMGTATGPIYTSNAKGIPVHVWVRETRPRLQGARLTAWELSKAGIPHTVVADNAGGWLMRQGWVDAVIVGADRVAKNGDVCNKIGTYSLALSARDNAVPFFVAFPSSTVDMHIASGDDIPIEFRSEDEVTNVEGPIVAGSTIGTDQKVVTVRAIDPSSSALNPAFDVTPSRLVTALITERGVCQAGEEGLGVMFPSDNGRPDKISVDIAAPILENPASAPSDGVIKFSLHWEVASIEAAVGALSRDVTSTLQELAVLNETRSKLYNLGLLGSYPDGVAFGNVSCLLAGSGSGRGHEFRPFVITGTQTGSLLHLAPEHHYTVVSHVDESRNALRCVGPVKASSESMTHATVYAAGGDRVRCVLHFHNRKIWSAMLQAQNTTAPGAPPATRASVAYGTPDMCREVRRLFAESDVLECGYFLMAGHEDGVVTFGETIIDAFAKLEKIVHMFG